MKVTEKDVQYVARLSRLLLTDEEKESYTHSLNDILDYFDKLGELDTSDIEATAHILPIKNVFREDEVKPSMDRDKILSNAPDAKDGCFRVPRVVE